MPAISGAKIANRIRNTMKARLTRATLLRRMRRQAVCQRDRPSTAAGASGHAHFSLGDRLIEFRLHRHRGCDLLLTQPAGMVPVGLTACG